MASGLKDSIVLQEENILNTYGTDYGDDDREAWDKTKYCENILVKIVKMLDFELEFDLVNVEAPFANALRRIMLAEVPCMAIDRILLYQNTSLIQDEVFCHRLGMIPIKVDPRLFQYRTNIEDDADVKPENTLEFSMHVKCTKNKSAIKEGGPPEEMYEHSKVYSSDLKWVPIGDQASRFANDPPKPVDSDILLNKMIPGQEIDLKCYCVKGIGRDHAKFSPVATASYRLLPDIKLTREVKGEAGERLKESFSKGVIKLKENAQGEKVAVVKDARKDMCSRNVFRHHDLADAVILSRRKRHFIFSVESTGALLSSDVVVEACKVMKEKCRSLMQELDSMSS